MNDSVPLLAAFTAGIASFVSPCVLPLVPGYLSYISGVSMEEMRRSDQRSAVLGRVMLNSLFFILGFTTVFVALGATASAIGQAIEGQRVLFMRVAGVLVVIFGLHMAGVFKIGFLNYEKRFGQGIKRLGLLGSFLVGFSFAFGWTPCVGPILAAILAYASTQETVGKGVLLLVTYSLGLGVPFFLAGIGLNVFFGFFERVKRYFRIVEILSGALLVVLGIMIFTDNLTQLIGYFT
jgi:cytochrome c-type biogenesis protein